MSSKKRLLAALLCLFFGIFGAHRFYSGQRLTAVVQLATVGGLGIWMLTDLLMILFGEFSDGDGRKIKSWL